MDFVGNVQLIRGNASAVKSVLQLLRRNGINSQGNPDVYVHDYSSFGVEEARELTQKASMRPVASARRIFVIATPSMTSEAQNALLKTLEEPSADALFFLIFPAPELLLPTLRSRAQVLALENTETAGAINVKKFLRAKAQERIDLLKPLLDKGDDDRRDLAASIRFLSDLEMELAKLPERNAAGLEAVYRARSYIGDKGSLMKALLEQVALLI